MHAATLQLVAVVGALGACSALPLLGSADDGGPLLACGTDGENSSDLKELVDVLGVAHGVCCDQLGEICDGESDHSLPSAANPATTCLSPDCARVVKLAADSCAPLLGAASFSLFAKPYQDILDHATAACAAATSAAPLRFAITDSARSKDIDASGAGPLPAALTDGMGAGGHVGSIAGQDTATLRAVPGEELAVVLSTLWLAARDSLRVWLDGVAQPPLTGQALPPVEGRTFRSKPGGTIRVTMVQDPNKAAGTASLFSVAIPCVGDASCGAHGSCDGGGCSCTNGYIGSQCKTLIDPCYDIDCGAHGSCNGGSCTCRDRYAGNRCQTQPKPCCSQCTPLPPTPPHTTLTCHIFAPAPQVLLACSFECVCLCGCAWRLAFGRVL
jgi:hypothetical protein